jgi:hypothetical protein
MTFAVAGGFIVGSLVAISLVTMAVANPGSKAHDWVSSLKKKKKKEKQIRLRLFRCKTFYIVKYFQMQMISGKIIFFFSVFVCILGKCSGKYSTLCVWSNVKQNNKKNPHPKPPESTKNGNHHCQPPRSLIVKKRGGGGVHIYYIYYLQ